MTISEVVAVTTTSEVTLQDQLRQTKSELKDLVK